MYQQTVILIRVFGTLLGWLVLYTPKGVSVTCEPHRGCNPQLWYLPTLERGLPCSIYGTLIHDVAPHILGGRYLPVLSRPYVMTLLGNS